MWWWKCICTLNAFARFAKNGRASASIRKGKTSGGKPPFLEWEKRELFKRWAGFG
jgi:hypothetical protein